MHLPLGFRRVAFILTSAGLVIAACSNQTNDGAPEMVSETSADAHNFRGTLLERSGDRAGALADFLEAVRLRPDFGLAHLNAARILAGNGDIAGARAHLAEVVKGPDSGMRTRAEAMLRELGGRQ